MALSKSSRRAKSLGKSANETSLVGRGAIRPGGEQYVRLHGTRGAATLLKSNVTVYGETVRLHFQAKGGKPFEKDVHAPKVAYAIDVLRRLPGRRLFQYRTTEHELRTVSTQDVNRFLREIAGVQISLKDFRTLLASVSVIVLLMHARAGRIKRARRRQVLDAICEAAAELGNTPAICGKSYVNKTIMNAFEDGLLERFAETLRGCRSSTRAEKVLGQIAAGTAAAGAT
jgi:DNA topoisomerase-1